MSDAELASRLRRDGPRISAAVIAEMWTDPFWGSRFGDRGVKRASEDGAFHVEYLVQAVEAADGDVMRRYATWLQSVLVTRGMCTRHLDDNFERLAKALARELPGCDAAIGHLRAAREALVHSSPRARELQAFSMQDGVDRRVAHVCSYLADAIGFDRADLFTQHARWLTEAEGERALDAARVAIEAATSLSEGAKQAARALLGPS